MKAILGKKVGMTQIFKESGVLSRHVPGQIQRGQQVDVQLAHGLLFGKINPAIEQKERDVVDQCLHRPPLGSDGL